MIFHLLFFVINSLFVPVRILSCDVVEDGKPHSERKKKKLFLKELDGKNDATHTPHTYEYVISLLLDVHKKQWISSWPTERQPAKTPGSNSSLPKNSLAHYPTS